MRCADARHLANHLPELMIHDPWAEAARHVLGIAGVGSLRIRRAFGVRPRELQAALDDLARVRADERTARMEAVHHPAVGM